MEKKDLSRYCLIINQHGSVLMEISVFVFHRFNTFFVVVVVVLIQSSGSFLINWLTLFFLRHSVTTGWKWRSVIVPARLFDNRICNGNPLGYFIAAWPIATWTWILFQFSHYLTDIKLQILTAKLWIFPFVLFQFLHIFYVSE